MLISTLWIQSVRSNYEKIYGANNPVSLRKKHRGLGGGLQKEMEAETKEP